MENNLAVLIDFENLAAGVEKEGLGRFKLDAVLRRLKDKGRILVARSYGDWGRFAKYKQDLLRLGVQLMELTAYRGQEKNRADIALAVDAMELAYTRAYLDTFVVISGDSDFTPLIMRLKELNKRVIGMGTRRSTSGLLKDTCDEFIFYESVIRQEEDILEPHVPVRSSRMEPMREPPREPVREPPRESDDDSSESEEVRTLTKDEAFALLAETVRGLTRDAPGSVPASVVKASVLRKEPAFDESEYGFPSFTRMLEAAQSRGLIVMKRDERGGGARVEVPVDEVVPPSEPEAAQPEGEDLPGLDGEAARLRERLAADGTDPLPRLYRHTVVYEFADHVQSRMAQKKRNTLMYAVGDIARRCRDTDPQVPSRHVKSVLHALANAGELLHPDGKPVRSPTAPFQIRKDGEGLLDALSAWYLRRLAELGESISNSRALSQLLYGDEEHTTVVEEMVAWIQHDLAEGRNNRDEGRDEPRPEAREAREPRGDGRGEPRGDRGDRGDRGGRDGRRNRRDRRRDRRGGPEGREEGAPPEPIEYETAEMAAAWAAGEPLAAGSAPAETAQEIEAAPAEAAPAEGEPVTEPAAEAAQAPEAAPADALAPDAPTEEAAEAAQADGAAADGAEKKKRTRRRTRRKTDDGAPSDTPA